MKQEDDSKAVSKKVTKIIKRDGSTVDFDKTKIITAVFKAAQSVGGEDRATAEKLADEVVNVLDDQYDGKRIPHVEEVQDIVEKVLIEQGHAQTAKAYILYRQKHKELREAKSMIMGKEVETKLSVNALQVLKERYLLKDKSGALIETPDELFRRVAKNVAQADKLYDKDAELSKTEEEFFQMMSNLEFLPNSPTLMNAGTKLQQLSACFVLPVGDSIEEIFETVKNTAVIHKSGGGTGFSFSRLRPRNDLVMSTKGVASGPLSFMRVFDVTTEVIKQGGKRRGANMAILRVDHPDIIDFITSKEKLNALNNFNISVALTDKFMKAVEKDEEYELISPHDNSVVKRLPARNVFDLIVLMAWKNGEPGIIFIDEINRANPTPKIGEVESTNPCGEQPLLPYESCNLGSINLGKFVENEKINYDALRETVKKAVHFLDNVIDMNRFPLKKIEDMTKANRKIGLGVMGFADMLFQLNFAYNSKDGVETGKNIMKFVCDEARKMSEELGKKRGSFPNFKDSIWASKYKTMRNATVTTIAPTGTLSMIADCSSGVEPLFAISFVKRVMDNRELVYVNAHFENYAKKEGFYSEELMKSIANKGSIHDVKEIPEEGRRIFVVSHDIRPEWHVNMQAAFQEHVDNAVSKTVNFPNWATTEDVKTVYLTAYKLGCKGITVYRDGSRENQVLNIEITKKEEDGKKKGKFLEKCPECGSKMKIEEGCSSCPQCGYSICSL